MEQVGNIITGKKILTQFLGNQKNGVWETEKFLVKNINTEIAEDRNRVWAVFGKDRSSLIALGDLIPRKDRIIY